MKINWTNATNGFYTIMVTILMLLFMFIAYNESSKIKHLNEKIEFLKYDVEYYKIKTERLELTNDKLLNYVIDEKTNN